ncbi:acyltransferase family protein [Sphingobacterium lactis]|uniref:acyltransferase family protein n=1 Tax=Sphingobacterium lactis TaxID=797291 RepID=UPI003DA38EEF
MEFRRDIQALRAFAVISVLLYHFRFPFIFGGYIGVDIFFVISGYLMTKIILGKIDRDKFSLKDFYGRRLTRIFPSLLAVVLIFLVLIFFILPIKLNDYLSSALSSSLFISNISYYLKSGYFDISSQENFLLHTWSLSVEWQFYLLYPLFLLGWRRFGKTGNDLTFLILLTIISILIMLIANRHDSSFSFYMFPARGWEMILGGIAYKIEDNFCLQVNKALRNTIVIASSVVLFLCAFHIIPINTLAWPSYYTFIPVVSTFLIIICKPTLKIYTNNLLVAIGNLSYSWYLWHWPIFVLCMYFIPDLKLYHKFAFLISTYLISYLSYKWIEQNKIFSHAKPVLLATICISAICWLLSNTKIYYRALDQNLRKYTEFYDQYKDGDFEKQFGVENGHLTVEDDKHIDTLTFFQQIKKGKRNILLLGDSHMGMFSHDIKRLNPDTTINYISISASATFPVNLDNSPYKNTGKLMKFVFNTFIPKVHQDLSGVIISANYAGYDDRKIIEFFSANEQYFGSYNLPIRYLGQTHEYKFDYPIVESIAYTYGIPADAYVLQRGKEVNELLKNSKWKNQYVDIYDLSVNTAVNDKIYLFDTHHLSIFGAQQYINRMHFTHVFTF